jgi:anaerobic magnesium-protoporphyrin IX monomethyl ester cyclase
VIVHGEGEATVVELAAALAQPVVSLAQIKGITWRNHGQIVTNPVRPPIANLDEFRPGWELVDWTAYKLFGFGRAAGMQFSRGCTLRCTYCGQWSFWRRWRHRSPQNFVDELKKLVCDYGVRIVWLADENFAADREMARQTLEAIVERRLGLSINLNMTAADVVRDADLLPLYKRAGVDNIVMGVESLDDSTVERVHKNNPFAVSKQAVRLLRQQGIVSLVNIIYGLEDETPTTLLNTYRRVFELDADVLNAVYITPHHWTEAGRQVQAAQMIEPNQAQWTYRNQIVRTPHLAPWQLLLGVKLTEALFHLRPRALRRMLTGGDLRYRQIMRAYLAVGARVVLAEIGEFLINRLKNLSYAKRNKKFSAEAQRRRDVKTNRGAAKTEEKVTNQPICQGKLYQG